MAESEFARFHFECYYSQKKKMKSRDFASKSRDFIFLTCKVWKQPKAKSRDFDAKSRDFILNTKYFLKLEWNLQDFQKHVTLIFYAHFHKENTCTSHWSRIFRLFMKHICYCFCELELGSKRLNITFISLWSKSKLK